MLSPAPTDVIIYRMFKPTTNPLCDARWSFQTEERTQRNGTQFDKHIKFTHRQARILQSQSYKNNARIQSKQEHNAELQPNKRQLSMYTYSGLLTRLVPHTFTPKAKKVKATLIGKEADRSVDQMHVEPG